MATAIANRSNVCPDLLREYSKKYHFTFKLLILKIVLFFTRIVFLCQKCSTTDINNNIVDRNKIIKDIMSLYVLIKFFLNNIFFFILAIPFIYIPFISGLEA